MYRAVFALFVLVMPLAEVRAQAPDPAVTADQQQMLQGLLNNAIVAVRQNDQAAACNLRGQALEILNNNLVAFQTFYPANDWSDLQRSLQGSLRRCAAQGAQAP